MESTQALRETGRTQDRTGTVSRADKVPHYTRACLGCARRRTRRGCLGVERVVTASQVVLIGLIGER